MTIKGNLSFNALEIGAVALKDGTATFSQGGFSPDDAINYDYDAGKGWAVYDGISQGIPSTAAFETTGTVAGGAGTTLNFKLYHLGSWAGHSLGKFRLSVTDDDRANFCDGLDTGGDVTANWTVLTPGSYSSSGGSNMSPITTGTWAGALLVSLTPTPTPDTYTVTCTTSLANITGVRLEALADASLPWNGPGRADNGNFVVTEFKVLEGAGGGYKYPSLDIDVLTHGGAAGTHHDQLVVTGNVANLGNAKLVVHLPAPSAGLRPAGYGAAELASADMTIIDGGGTVTGAAFGDYEVTSSNPLIAAHWEVINTATAVTVSGGDVILHGANLQWNGHKGDADLNDEVDVLDLAKLANNFGRKDDGVNWVSADFDLNGEVDVLDLAAIANAFGWKVTGGEGGAPVPEPITLAVLALGAAMVIRRRRR